MGLPRIEATVANPLDSTRQAAVSFLVDSGAIYSVVPTATLEGLNIVRTGERMFLLANGEPVRRRIGEARITLEGQSATCVVLFGEEGDAALLGVTTLENLGLIFDPMRQRLMPLPMLLAEFRRLLL